MRAPAARADAPRVVALDEPVRVRAVGRPPAARAVTLAKGERLEAHDDALGVPAGAHPFHDIETTGGVLADDAAELMKSFFRQRRASPPEVEKPGSDADAAFNFL